jgi:hypothetical protein
MGVLDGKLLQLPPFDIRGDKLLVLETPCENIEKLAVVDAVEMRPEPLRFSSSISKQVPKSAVGGTLCNASSLELCRKFLSDEEAATAGGWGSDNESANHSKRSSNAMSS